MTNSKGEKAIVKTNTDTDKGTDSSIDGGSRIVYGGDRHDDAVRDLEKIGFEKDPPEPIRWR